MIGKLELQKYHVWWLGKVCDILALSVECGEAIDFTAWSSSIIMPDNTFITIEVKIQVTI